MPPTPNEPTPTHLETRDLSVRRAGATLLTDVTVSFGRAQVSAIVGPSGAGKTTLLRCLNGLEAYSGTVLLDGEDAEGYEPTDLRRRVGLVFQVPMLFEGSVLGNLAYGIGTEVTPDAAASVLERVALAPDLASRKATSLSVGEAQRVAIARALLRGPEILLMDEPTSALDRDARATIEDLIASLSASGLTIVLVTHDLGQAERIAQNAWIMVEGSVRGGGPPHSLEQMWAQHR